MIHLSQMVCKKATVLGTQPLGYLEPGTFLRKKRTCGSHQARKETPQSGGPAETSQSRWGFPFSVFSVVFTGCRPFRICYKARIQHAVSKPISLYKDMGDCLAFLGIRDKEERGQETRGYGGPQSRDLSVSPHMPLRCSLET